MVCIFSYIFGRYWLVCLYYIQITNIMKLRFTIITIIHKLYEKWKPTINWNGTGSSLIIVEINVIIVSVFHSTIEHGHGWYYPPLQLSYFLTRGYFFLLYSFIFIYAGLYAYILSHTTHFCLKSLHLARLKIRHAMKYLEQTI